MRLLIMIILPVVAGLIAYVSPKITGKNSTIGIQLLSLGVAVYNLKEVVRNGDYSIVVGNYDQVAGITLRADLLSSVMIFLTALIFLMSIIYARENEKLESHFFFLYLVLQSCMIALFVTRDIFNIFVIIEVCTIIIAVLIMYKNDKSLYDSLIYLMNNTVAMIFFLFGVAILYRNLATLNLDLLGERIAASELRGSYIAAYAMLITGVSFKCALAPLFSWLPRAHAAKGVPTVVSAVLSSLYIKTGFFVFVRVREIFHPMIDIDSYLMVITLTTSMIGGILAVRARNIKLILAYSTISQIGLIMTGILLGNDTAWNGGLFHLINHAIFKSTLFLCAGIFIKHYGHKDITGMRGAFRSMPVVSIAAILSLLGVTGAPFFNGSISKYYIEAGAAGTYGAYLIPMVNTLTIVYFFKFFRIFPGKASLSMNPAASESLYKKVSVVILGSLCLIEGIFFREVMSLSLGYNGEMDMRKYFIKGVVYFITMGASWIFFRYKKEFKTFRLTKKFSPSFNGISIMTCFFFVFTAMAIYLETMA